MCSVFVLLLLLLFSFCLGFSFSLFTSIAFPSDGNHWWWLKTRQKTAMTVDRWFEMELCPGYLVSQMIGSWSTSPFLLLSQSVSVSSITPSQVKNPEFSFLELHNIHGCPVSVPSFLHLLLSLAELLGQWAY